VEDHRRLSFIAFGSSQGLTGHLYYYPPYSLHAATISCRLATALIQKLSADCCELARSALWDMLQLVQLSKVRPRLQGHSVPIPIPRRHDSKVVRTLRSAGDPQVALRQLLEEERVQGDPRGPGAPPHHRRGSALLAVLWLSAALSAIVFAMSVTVRGETVRTATSMDELRSYYLASAGVQKATLELLWTVTQGATLIPPGAFSVDYNFPSGTAHVEMIPESAKLNINRATPEQLLTLLTALGVESARATTIAAGIVDWRGPAIAGSPFDAYYLSLTPSFQAPHASFQEIEEILSVRGVTPDIFYGTWTAAGNGDAGENPLVRRAGLNDCLTVYGMQGTGDVNTALAVAGGNAAAMAAPGALPGGGQGIAGNIMNLGSAIVTFRSTARLRLPDGTLSDMRRTVGAQVKYVPFASAERPYYVLRWYDTAWSY
jgi:general secretion pathway protein K